MISPRLSNCNDCSDIEQLIEDINCKIVSLSKDAYANIIYGFRQSTKFTLMYDLIHYRRILQYKSVNSDYLEEFPDFCKITSRVRILIGKT